MPRPNFPFAAVSGQAQFKRALILVAINPKIGGVLVSGPRGSGKSTLARGLASIMASAEKPPGRFVTLPLGASEEMLLGTLNLQQVLNEQKVEFQPGLLAKADGGVLYVDEVNLLQDNLVDQLLDVAASGVNIVERDGVSHSHSAEFILLGTMNPDEGEIRLQLQDRFGLAVKLKNQYSVEERMEIVRLREKFDADPEAFVGQYQDQQQRLSEKIALARKHLQQVECSESLRLLIAERCDQAHVDGLRADIVWFRAAVAYAAWQGRNDVIEEDILAVEELVLAHRRCSASTNPPTSDDQPPPVNHGKPSPFSRPQTQIKPQQQSNQKQKKQSPSGDWGSMQPQQLLTDDKISISAASQKANTVVLKSGVTESHAKKRGFGTRGVKVARHFSHKIDWLATFNHNKAVKPLHSLRHKKANTGRSVLHLVLLDTSASTLKNRLFAKAKAVILGIAEQAYLDREQLMLLGFGNGNIETLLPKKRAPKAIKQLLDIIPAAGGTPLREVLQQAYHHQLQQLKKNPALELKTYLITDGKTSQQVAKITMLGNVTVVDIEDSPVKRGKALQIAEALAADYFLLPV